MYGTGQAIAIKNVFHHATRVKENCHMSVKSLTSTPTIPVNFVTPPPVKERATKD